ncbi:hypothetical protein AB0D54_27340 [Streptomyces xanthophaeus]|uniref:hypothetical protein n=1 Tax=Streptomyces xanthophaeus TaxID=67385 RepID=UPI0034406FE6
MCRSCGCRQIPLIKETTAEHETVTNAAGDALRALHAGDLPGAAALVATWRPSSSPTGRVRRTASSRPASQL